MPLAFLAGTKGAPYRVSYELSVAKDTGEVPFVAQDKEVIAWPSVRCLARRANSFFFILAHACGDLSFRGWPCVLTRVVSRGCHGSSGLGSEPPVCRAAPVSPVRTLAL